MSGQCAVPAWHNQSLYSCWALHIIVCVSMLQVDKAQEGTGDNHAISALKFKIIREFLELGWNVLLSDVDVVIVQVSFQATHVRALHLWRCLG